MIGNFWSTDTWVFSGKIGIYLRYSAEDVLPCKRLGWANNILYSGI